MIKASLLMLVMAPNTFDNSGYKPTIAYLPISVEQCDALVKRITGANPKWQGACFEIPEDATK